MKMVRQGKKVAVNPEPALVREELWVWHPEAHRRFGEWLFYFLLAIKPFDREVIDNEISELLKKFGVPRYCSYQLFGNFDCLVRVWLPPRAARAFLHEAQTMSNVRTVLDFKVQVDDKRVCWVLEEAKRLQPKTTPATMVTRVQRLTEDQIRAEQDNNDEAIRKELSDQLLIIRKPARIVDDRQTIKAFIAFSPPEQSTSDGLRGVIMNQLTEALTDPIFQFREVSLMHGDGFCWSLAKVVAGDYGLLGRFINRVNKALSVYGISSNTFLVVKDPPPLEGESISGAALEEYRNPNSFVATLLPELYKVAQPPMKPTERAAIEEFVTDYLLPPEENGQEGGKAWKPPAGKDLEAYRNFLKAAVINDRDEAFIAFFPIVKDAERRLREPLGRLAAKCYPDGVRALLESLRQQKEHPPNSLDNLSLKDALQAWQVILKKIAPDDDWVTNKLNDNVFKEIAEMRNTIMHDRPFDPRKEWMSFATRMLNLIEIRDRLELYYGELYNR